MTTHEVICLLPTLVPFLGVLFNVAARHLSKRAASALGSFFGRRVFAFYHAQHQLGGYAPSIRKADGVGGGEMIPARAAVIAIDELPRLVAGGLYAQR